MSKVNSKPTISKEIQDQDLQESKSDSEAEDVDSEEDEEVIVSTRAGRKIKKPIRYGWNN